MQETHACARRRWVRGCSTYEKEDSKSGVPLENGKDCDTKALGGGTPTIEQMRGGGGLPETTGGPIPG